MNAMNNNAKTISTKTAIALGLTAAVVAQSAMAGSDTTFSSISTLIESWTQGSLGDLVSLGTLAVGLAMGIVKQTLMPVAIAAGIAVAANYGPTIITGIAAAGL